MHIIFLYLYPPITQHWEEAHTRLVGFFFLSEGGGVGGSLSEELELETSSASTRPEMSMGVWVIDVGTFSICNMQIPLY